MMKDYRYCPYCATALVEKFRFEQVRPICPACGFVHFRDPKVAVIALVIHDGRVLLVQRGVNPGKGLWALPGGYMDAHEMPTTALRRELEEEVGLAVQAGRLIKIYPMADGAGNGIGIVIAYTASPAGPVEISQTGDDVQAAGWFLPNDIPDTLAFESTITLISDWLDER